MGGKTTGILFLVLSFAVWTQAKVRYSVQCSESEMVVRVQAAGVRGVELEKWGELPGCQAKFDTDHFILNLPLDQELTCGITRVKNRMTGETVFYHRVAVTSETTRNVVLVKCRIAPDNSTYDNIVKRDVLPPEFEEPDYIEITSEVSGTAPIPILGVGVRQDGNLIGGQINVRPGTPLTMEVYLDDVSAGTYGILMSYMEVTDTRNKQETIVFNGCSVDPILFDNFITTNGNYVSAKFRAFKFPETNYVLFRGTVDVCLDKCQGIACSNGQLGFGRRRRSVNSTPADPNKIFEVTMTTFLKLEEEEVIGNNGTSSLVIEEDVERVATITEEIADDLTKKMAKSMVAVERAIEDSHDTLTWKSSDIYNPIRSSSNNEPAFIYFNSGHRLSGNFWLSLVALLLFLRQ